MSENRTEVTEFFHSIGTMIDRATALDLALPAYLLKIAKLSVGMQIHGIDDSELKAFSDCVSAGEIIVYNKKDPAARRTERRGRV